MTPSIRSRALRMAAKAALVTSLGCAGSARSGAPRTVGNDGAPPVAQPDAAPTDPAACAAHLDGLRIVNASELEAGDPLRDEPGVFAAFHDRAARTSAQTLTCCEAELADQGGQAAHRFACCSAIGPTADAMACTPWGPPCPPEMPIA